jgi:hypothetical protein
MIAVIRQSETDFDRAVAKDSIHHACDPNGLTATHFAIYWPGALQQLIRAGADVNCKDRLGRRPIHLAVACGQVEAVLILLEMDCSFGGPNDANSLLQESLIQGQHFDHVTSRIIDGLIDRHTRLINLASSVLPDHYEFRRQFGQSYIVERDAPFLLDALARSKYPIPPDLDADRDGLSVYDTAELHARIRLTTTLADQLWNGGFRYVDGVSPISNLTPLLQSWYVANFDMVSWFIGKGASPFTKSLPKSHSGLHLFAARISYPGLHFHHDRFRVPGHNGLVKQLMDDGNMWHDSCRCLCSPNGCTPISIAVKQWLDPADGYKTLLDLSRVLHGKLLYRPKEDPKHVEQLLRIFVFEKIWLKHTCCRIDQFGNINTWNEWRSTGKSAYSGFENKFHQVLADCTSKMLRCGCDMIGKPACAVYREKCESRRVIYCRKSKKGRTVYRQKVEGRR